MFIKFYRVIFFLLLLLMSKNGFAQDFQSIQNLIARRFQKLERKVSFAKIENVQQDTASYYSVNNQLFIHANTVNAAAYALYDYVKKYCHSSLSHTGDNMQIPDALPATNDVESVSAVFPLRYALNYCTINYTMSFWNWEQWEKELDWMSLNGVNLMLAPIGTEEVWQKTLLQLGFSDKEIRDFIPGPAFNAWWLMGNLEGWGGPVSNRMIQHWTNLQKKILARMRELNIQPVIQGFEGLVPSTLKNHFPNAKIVEQGNWCGFRRPSILLANDTLFKKTASLYYQNFKQLYGNDFKYLGGDLFHEGGNTSGVNLSENAKSVQQNMQANFPNAVWVLQGWGNNPKEEILQGLNAQNTLIIDLLGDQEEIWLQRNQYNNFPWIWSTVSNFGGKTTTGSALLRVLNEPKKAERIFGNSSTLQGVGILPEGIENNAIVYQWALDGAWDDTSFIQKKLETFITARYGEDNPFLNEAWQYLLQTVYNGREPNISNGQGGYESIFCARPDTNFITTTSCCGPTKLWYDPALLTQAALDFSKVANQFQNMPTFQYDLVDTWRQVINLRAREVYAELMKAYQQKNRTAFEKNKNLFIQLLLLQDKWLGTNRFFRLGRRLNQARTLLPDSTDKKLCEWNARMQITYWGTNETNGYLHEYANKEWQGILKDLYLPRWENFFEYAEAKMNGKQAAYPKFFAMEKTWCEQQNLYSDAPAGNSEILLPQLIKMVSLPTDSILNDTK